ncbi:MAG: hypothetical protein ACRD22_04870 [Terriglobia bacterium]
MAALSADFRRSPASPQSVSNGVSGAPEAIGRLPGFYCANNQFHEVWAMMDHHSKIVDIETGVGFGVTAGADKLTLKLMLSRDINPRPAAQL